MSGRLFQPYVNNSLAIRQEIQRFESVHPSIYAIYDLIECIPDALVAQQIRDHVVCIEDSFVNSQEWTLSRSVPDLRLGIVGSLSSGKSALVHRYLTGSYMQEESPEGGRFKKEILVDGHSYLLLIRDEGGPPELQFTSWVDAVIFVFSLENETSFNAVYNYYTKMAHYRNSSEIPLILVGTQDAISENNPRVIDDARARKLAADLKRCSYYETCATYGLNVERVFQDACQKIVQQKGSLPSQVPLTPTNSRPSTPNHAPQTRPSPGNGWGGVIGSPNTNTLHHGGSSPSHLTHKESISRGSHTLSASSHQLHRHGDGLGEVQVQLRGVPQVSQVPQEEGQKTRTLHPDNNNGKDLPTPTSTPTTSRKSRRRSNLFTSKKGDDKLKNGELGSGRAIPLKQGLLYKRSSKSLNKEWKKKYVALCEDGRLTYYPNLQDYMDNVHGKEISLQYVTVKVPGQKPRGSQSIQNSNGLSDGLSSLTIANYHGKGSRLAGDRTLPLAPWDSGPVSLNSQDDGIGGNHVTNGTDKMETPNVKKRHRRMKSSGLRNQDCEDSDGYEFFIVSLDNKQWHFDASNTEERDSWVSAIEQQILNSLQGNEIAKSRVNIDTVSLAAIRTKVPGNTFCVDCDSSNPDWASLNLGVLMCIECSGIHRNLGSHITKVRSLDLDEWPPGHLAVMLAVGNQLANTVWEADTRGRDKPSAGSSREDKERWIRCKYETKDFLPALPGLSGSVGQQLVDAVCRSDMRAIVLVLAQCAPDDVNATVSARDLRTPLHLAAAMASLSIAQLLIWYGANVRALDHDGRSCLWHARTVSSKQAPAPADTASLIDVLTAAGCPDTGPVQRRKDVIPIPFNKLPTSII